MTPTRSEVAKTVSAMKNNNASGIDTINSELIKTAGDTAINILHKIIKNLWEQKQNTPAGWGTGLINPIPKEVDLTLCQNYRSTTLLSTAYKIMTHIIREKLDPFYEELIRDYQ